MRNMKMVVMLAVFMTAGFAKADLIGHWTFNESTGTTASDSSGNGNDATLKNMAGTEWTTGIAGNALQFDNVDDWVQTADLGSRTSITVSLWMKVADFDDYQGVFSSPSWIDGGFCMMAYNNSSKGNMEGVLKENVTDRARRHPDASPGLSAGTWHHVALVADLSDGDPWALYVDGVLQSNANDTVLNYRGTTDLGQFNIGRMAWETNRYFNGLLDDVQIYDECLTSNQIAWMKDNPGATIYMEHPELIGHWKFDENSGTNAFDSSEYGHDAILKNMAGTEWTAGRVGNALQFDNIDDWVETANLGSRTSITVSLWMNVADFTDAQGACSTPSWINGGFNMLAYSNSAKGNLEVVLKENVTDRARRHPDASPGLSAGTWYHVALVADLSDGDPWALYVDGVLQSNANDTVLNYRGATDLGKFVIGHVAWESARYFNGLLDDIQIYAIPLSADQVAWLKRHPGEVIGPPRGTVIVVR